MTFDEAFIIVADAAIDHAILLEDSRDDTGENKIEAQNIHDAVDTLYAHWVPATKQIS